MRTTLDIDHVRQQLSKLLDRVRAGEEIIITVKGEPRGRLIPQPVSDKSAG
jgi:prevent-host-death family protein